MQTYLLNLWDALRTSFWFIPSVVALAALVLGIAMPILDDAIAQTQYEFHPRLQTTTDAARSILSAITGATITMAATVFSITVVTLSLTSQQFGPRLLRTFMLDLPTQCTLAVFVSTSLYCLLVLRVVDDAGGNGAPHLSVSLGVIFAVMSLAMLIMFVHHVSVMIQAPHVVKMVAHDLDAAVERLFPEDIGQPPSEEDRAAELVADQAVALDEPQWCVWAGSEGYIQAIDGEGLLTLAISHDLIVRLNHRPGDFLRRGAPLAELWSETTKSESDVDNISRELNEAIIVGMRRTPRQDVECVVNELVEVAVRSLSPGINDPFTAINCVDSLCASLGRLTQRKMPTGIRCDDDGLLRIVSARPTTFENVVDAALDQIRQYGRDSVGVTIRLLEGLHGVAELATREEDRHVLLRHASMIFIGAGEALPEEHDRRQIEQRYERLLQALGPDAVGDAVSAAQ